jgi:hypothetical protein
LDLIKTLTFNDLQNRYILNHFSFENKSKFPDIEKNIDFKIMSFEEKFVIKILFNSVKGHKKKNVSEELTSKFKRVQTERWSTCIDSFELDMFHIEELVANKNKKSCVFLGKYSVFDNDLLLKELVDIYKEKQMINYDVLREELSVQLQESVPIAPENASPRKKIPDGPFSNIQEKKPSNVQEKKPSNVQEKKPSNVQEKKPSNFQEKKPSNFQEKNLPRVKSN